MDDYVAVEGPPWVWVLAVLGLFFTGAALGALAWYTVGARIALRRIDTVADATREELEALRRELFETRREAGLEQTHEATVPSPAPIRA